MTSFLPPLGPAVFDEKYVLLLARHRPPRAHVNLPARSSRTPRVPLSPPNYNSHPPHPSSNSQKCDEQREEGDSCRTCRRLQLSCLGWGPRRPDWMRVRRQPASAALPTVG
jgi:hypothetical protein